MSLYFALPTETEGQPMAGRSETPRESSTLSGLDPQGVVLRTGLACWRAEFVAKSQPPCQLMAKQ